MHRGVLIVGIAGIIVAVANIFVTSIYSALLCFDACVSVRSSIQSAPQAVALPLLSLTPALALIIIGWLWQLAEIRRMGAYGMRAFVATFPAITVVVIASGTIIATIRDGAPPLDFMLSHLWIGGLGLAVWPLLVSVVAFISRHRPGNAGAAISASSTR